MKRAVWLACFLLIAHWLFSWKLTQLKIEKLQQASDHIDEKIDATLELIRKQMGDNELWQEVKQSLPKSK